MGKKIFSVLAQIIVFILLYEVMTMLFLFIAEIMCHFDSSFWVIPFCSISFNTFSYHFIAITSMPYIVHSIFGIVNTICGIILKGTLDLVFFKKWL